MSFFDAIKYARADQARKIRREGQTSYVRWFTTPDAVGFKDENGEVVLDFSVEDILAEDWEIVEAE